MFCQECGTQLDDNAKFCVNCGKPVSGKPENVSSIPKVDQSVIQEPINLEKKQMNMNLNTNSIIEGKKISNNIFLCKDGKYRWVYEMSLLSNPTIFWLIWKIFFFIILGIMILLAITSSFDSFFDMLKCFVYSIGGMTVLIGAGYLLYAIIMGGKYIVMFEMDKEGVNHKQLPKQAKKADVLSLLTTMLGVASGNLTVAGIGLNSAVTEMYSEFAVVSEVKAYPKTNVIKVNGLLEHNQVYADKEDFDFVLNFIKDHVPETCKVK